MLLKNLSVACVFISLALPALQITPSKYQAEAQEWVNTYVISKQNKLLMNSSDLQLCANLFYFSYLRSATTIWAQDIACDALTCMWQGWQNIAQTRMNPSLDLPYPTDYTKQENLYKDFIKAQTYHRMVGKTYAYVADAAVNQDYLTEHSRDAILEVRERSREEVVFAFIEVKKILGDLIDYALINLRSDWIEWDDQETVRFDFLDTISHYIPYFALKSFLEVERINTQASEQTWQVITTLCDVNKQMWEAIEIARGSYYLAYYQEISNVMQ
jgi:hypothetical protein